MPWRSPLHHMLVSVGLIAWIVFNPVVDAVVHKHSSLSHASPVRLRRFRGWRSYALHLIYNMLILVFKNDAVLPRPVLIWLEGWLGLQLANLSRKQINSVSFAWTRGSATKVATTLRSSSLRKWSDPWRPLQRVNTREWVFPLADWLFCLRRWIWVCTAESRLVLKDYQKRSTQAESI